ncbi:MAG: ABC transporter permease, partial [Chthoniobacterales bacterium]
MSPTTSITEAFRQWRIWWWFARRDIRSRYRGSVLGPLWLIATLGILVGGLSIVYGAVFNQPLKTFIPYLTAGFMAWWFVSVSITECCSAFINSSALIRNQPLPIAIYVLQTIARNVLILATNL